MNALLICPHCHGAISRTSRVCPSCGTATARGQELAGRRHDAAPQSIFLLALDALRSRGADRRAIERQFRDAFRDG